MLALDTALHLSATSAAPITPLSAQTNWWESLDTAVSALDSALETVTTATTSSSSSSGGGSGGGSSSSVGSETNTSSTAARANKGSEAQSSSNSKSGQGGGAASTTTTTTTSPVGGCVLVSGFLMDVDTWGKRLATHHRDLRVLQLHGEEEKISD
jgi:hypothetical protein